MRLALRRRVAAHHRAEARAEAERVQQPDRQPRRLVGADAEAPARGGERVQRFRHAGEGPGQGGQVFGVEVEEALHPARQRGQVERRAGGGEAALHQPRHAVADHARDGVERLRRQAGLGQHAVQRGGEVRHAVHQRAVEVEDGGARAGAQRRTARARQAAAPDRQGDGPCGARSGRGRTSPLSRRRGAGKVEQPAHDRGHGRRRPRRAAALPCPRAARAPARVAANSAISSSKCVKPCRATPGTRRQSSPGTGARASASASSQGASRHGVPGSSSIPPSRPRGGRRRSSTPPGRVGQQEVRAVAERPRGLRRLARQRVLDAAALRLARAAPGAERAGRVARGADRGAEVEQRLREVAGPLARRRVRHEALRQRVQARAGAGQRLLHRAQPRHHALHVGVQRHDGPVEGDGGDRGRGVGADAGQRPQPLHVAREAPPPAATTARAQACRLRARA